jgi:Na+/melibiose symporter-like transporter
LAGGPVGAVNYFGIGLILPFEIIYLHAVRGCPTATAGLVLAAVMGTAAVVTLPSGALLDRFRATPILITGNLVMALGYAGLAFVDRPGKRSSARPSAAPVSESREPQTKF